MADDVADTIGIRRMKEFDPDNKTVTAYLERFDLFVDVNEIADNKKVATLLTVIGAKHYSLIQGLRSRRIRLWQSCKGSSRNRTDCGCSMSTFGCAGTLVLGVTIM